MDSLTYFGSHLGRLNLIARRPRQSQEGHTHELVGNDGFREVGRCYSWARAKRATRFMLDFISSAGRGRQAT